MRKHREFTVIEVLKLAKYHIEHSHDVSKGESDEWCIAHIKIKDLLKRLDSRGIE